MCANFCNNCGKLGHIFYECKSPIISNGIIAFRKNNNTLEYLMIRRKHTFGYIDFMRGNYMVNNKDFILNTMKQMTNIEKNDILSKQFNELWCNLWGESSYNPIYRTEYNSAQHKFNIISNGITTNNCYYDLKSLINESNEYPIWDIPEWGFPKGRRNNHENDFNCAVREFCEETGYVKKQLYHVQNIVPIEEYFIGSNYKSYKHKYYIVFMDTNIDLPQFETDEVSDMKWKTFDESMSAIRPYNLEKRNVLTNIHNTLNDFILMSL